MKKYCALFMILAIFLCGCANNATPGQPSPTPAASTAAPQSSQQSSTPNVDASSLIRVDAPGCLPVSTVSIQEALTRTGRFTFQQVQLPGGNTDVYFRLDQPDGEDSDTAHIAYSLFTEDTTQILSYHFSKADVCGEKQAAIKWGLDLILQIFGTRLTDSTWDDIMDIAAKSETADPWGTDYEGYASQSSGIRLIYANLGGNVQIDIRPY